MASHAGKCLGQDTTVVFQLTATNGQGTTLVSRWGLHAMVSPTFAAQLRKREESVDIINLQATPSHALFSGRT